MTSPTIINLTQLQNSTTIVDVVIASNQFAENLLGGMFVIAIALIMMMVLVRKGNDFGKSALAVSYVCFFISLFMRYLGFVDVYLVLGFLLMMAIFGLIEYLGQD